MLTKRIIPCLDVKDGQVVKGVNFKNLVVEGDPVELAAWYSNEGADELVFLDITASVDSRRTVVDLIREVSRQVFIPFTVGGGVNSVADISTLLKAGADKVAMNTAAVKNSELVTAGAQEFGSQCIVVAIDAKRRGDSWVVYTHGGSRPTAIDAIDWGRQACDRGAGEILLTSMDADGTQQGTDLALNSTVADAVDIPVIASGGIGTLEHVLEAFTQGRADAALAASIFHRRMIAISDLKNYLAANHIPVRLSDG